MVRLAILVLAYVAVSASTPCSGACLPLTTVGGCHAQDGQESCGKHFAFGGATADTCEYNSAYQESICSTLWHAEGTARKCAEPVKDCPVVLAGQRRGVRKCVLAQGLDRRRDDCAMLVHHLHLLKGKGVGR